MEKDGNTRTDNKRRYYDRLQVLQTTLCTLPFTSSCGPLHSGGSGLHHLKKVHPCVHCNTMHLSHHIELLARHNSLLSSNVQPCSTKQHSATMLFALSEQKALCFSELKKRSSELTAGLVKTHYFLVYPPFTRTEPEHGVGPDRSASP